MEQPSHMGMAPYKFIHICILLRTTNVHVNAQLFQL